MASHLTTRDVAVCNFIHKTKLNLTSSQIATLFYSDKAKSEKSAKTIANRRLAIMIEKRQLKRVRQYVSQEYMYFAERLPSKLEHKKMMVDFLCELKKSGVYFDLDSVETEVRIWQKKYQIRPDLMMIIEDSRGEKYNMIVECDFSKKFTNEKYSNFIANRLTDSDIADVITNRMIIVSVCKNKPEPITLLDGRKYKPVWVNSDFSNISNISYIFYK